MADGEDGHPRALTVEDFVCQFRRAAFALRDAAGGELNDELKARVVGIVAGVFGTESTTEAAWTWSRSQ